MIYTYNRLEWHPGAEDRMRTPQFAVVDLDKHQARLLPIFNRLVAAHAKSQDPPERIEGFFAFGDRTPHEVGAASGAARKETATRYAKARGQFPNNPCGWSNHQAEGHTVRIRSMMILHSRGEAPSLSIPSVG